MLFAFSTTFSNMPYGKAPNPTAGPSRENGPLPASTSVCWRVLQCELVNLTTLAATLVQTVAANICELFVTAPD